jgi:26S proteasome regulatory subunit N1
MTYSDTQPRGTLRYRLLSASLRTSDSPLADPGTWGHEYVRHLAAELGEEFTAREEESLRQSTSTQDVETKTQLPGTIEDLRDLARQCAKFFLSHNAEPDAVDLFEELEIIGEVADLVDENTYGRVCQYMIRYVTVPLFIPHRPDISELRCVNFLPPPDDVSFLHTAHTIYVKHHKFPEALSIAIRLADPDLVREDFSAAANP